MLIWLAAVGSFALPPVGAFMHTRVLPWPWRRYITRQGWHAPFIAGWVWGASTGVIVCGIFGTIIGDWFPAVAYGASLLSCDLTAVILLEVHKRSLVRFLRSASEARPPWNSSTRLQEPRRSHGPRFSGDYPPKNSGSFRRSERFHPSTVFECKNESPWIRRW